MLARDHSLGREFLQPGEMVSLDGFSWQDPFQKKSKAIAPPPPHEAVCPPAGRNSSHGSLGMAPPHHTSAGGPPPPPDYWGRVPSDDRRREYSSGSIGSWSAPYPWPPPPPPGVPGIGHHRSGSWTHPPPPPPDYGPRRRSGSWGSGRENSLSYNPLHSASITQPADRRTFDSNRSSSGYWAPIPPPPPPPPGPYAMGPRISSGPMGPYRELTTPSYSFSPNSTPSPKPPYSVDMSIARSWSGGEVRRTWSEDQAYEAGQAWSHEYDGQPRPVPGADTSPFRNGASATPSRPHIVKRDTSNQNETYETKPSIKKAALNRDNSLASNRLKNQYMPEYYNFDTESELKDLSSNLEQSKLGIRPKPKPLGEEGRVSTIDAIAQDLMAKPQPLLLGDRVSTLDALDIDLETDPIIKEDELKDLPKPGSLKPDNRLT